ncbi:hypothetical protein MPTK2_1g17780 [Marchantia polymorpha subsp. ruderalis]
MGTEFLAHYTALSTASEGCVRASTSLAGERNGGPACPKDIRASRVWPRRGSNRGGATWAIRASTVGPATGRARAGRRKRARLGRRDGRMFLNGTEPGLNRAGRQSGPNQQGWTGIPGVGTEALLEGRGGAQGTTGRVRSPVSQDNVIWLEEWRAGRRQRARARPRPRAASEP